MNRPKVEKSEMESFLQKNVKTVGILDPYQLGNNLLGKSAHPIIKSTQ